MRKIIAFKKDGVRYNLCKTCVLVEVFRSKEPNRKMITGIQWALDNGYIPVYSQEEVEQVSDEVFEKAVGNNALEILEKEHWDKVVNFKKRKAYRNRKIVALITITTSLLFLIGMKEAIFKYPTLFIPLMGVWMMYSGLVFILAFEKFECDPKFIKLKDEKKN